MSVSTAPRLSDVKNDLKKIGCKLKSQLDGSWAIHEPKGIRVVVPSLEAVQEYYRAKSVSADCIPASVPMAPKPSQPRAVFAEQPSPAAAATPIAEPKPVKPRTEVSPEQQKAIATVNRVLKDMKEDRLQKGCNFLASELKGLLILNGCPAPLLEKTISYIEAKLHKDCIDKKLLKISFRNHEGQADAMYFDIRYAPFLKG